MPEHLVAFLIASALFIQVPGPSLLFTIGRALTVTREEALLSVVGNALGVFVQVVAVAFGLGAVMATSTHALSVVKVVGALYVVYLGIQAIRHRSDARHALEGELPSVRTSAWQSLRVGLTVGMTNPKTIVFFAAFLPQFVNPGSPAAAQVMLLGGLFAVIATLSDSCWALAAGRARQWFAKRPQRLDRLNVAGGAMMVGLGAVLISSE